MGWFFKKKDRDGGQQDARPAAPSEAFYTGSLYGGPDMDPGAGFTFAVEDVFTISGRGTVAVGSVQFGTVTAGMRLYVNGRSSAVTGIEQFRRQVPSASEGDTVGLLLAGADPRDLRRGAVLEGGPGPI